MKRSHLVPLLVLLAGPGCASTPETTTSDYLEADWILGSWRLDSFVRAGSVTRDVRLVLTFLPNGFVQVVNEAGTSNLAQQCRWYPRASWIDTTCGGVGLRIRDSEAGPLQVELTGAVQVPYTVRQCARYGVDANGNRICLRYERVQRYRTESARGEGVLEPHS